MGNSSIKASEDLIHSWYTGNVAGSTPSGYTFVSKHYPNYEVTPLSLLY